MTLHVSPNGPYVIQANTVNAEVLRQMLGSLTHGQSGVVSTNDMAVAAHGTPNMSVDIAAGFAVIAGTQAVTQGSYHAYNDATVNVAISASDPTNPRIDLVSLVVQDNQYGTAGDNVVFKVTAGTPSGSPSAPAAPASSVSLATVLVGATVTSITGGNITDVRPHLGPATAQVTTNEGTASTSYTDLATVGPSVTVVTGTQARVDLLSQFQNGGGGCAMSFAISGASTLAAADTRAITLALTSTAYAQFGGSYLITGLTAGSNTFTAKYKQIIGGSAFYLNRSIIVTPC